MMAFKQRVSLIILSMTYLCVLTSSVGFARSELPRAGVSISTAPALEVNQVLQGNTLELVNGKQVKLLGIIVPELEDPTNKRQAANRFGITEKEYDRFAKSARKLLKRLVGKNKIFLVDDPTDPSVSREDEFGRKYQYIFGRKRDYDYTQFSTVFTSRYYEKFKKGSYHLNVNATMIQNGYAMTDRRLPIRYRRVFERLEAEARTKKRGIWQK